MPSDTHADVSLSRKSTADDIVSSPASFYSPGSFRQGSVDSRSPFSVTRTASASEQDSRIEEAQAGIAPSRSRSPSSSPSRSRSARLHRSSSRLLRTIFRQRGQEQEQLEADAQEGQREDLKRMHRDSSSGSRSRSRGRRPSLRVSTNIAALGRREEMVEHGESRREQGSCSEATTETHVHTRAGERAASSAASLPRNHTRERGTGRGGAGGLLRAGVCPCEDGQKCTRRAICWATRRLRGRGAPS
jgi:hypothetical protein